MRLINYFKKYYWYYLSGLLILIILAWPLIIKYKEIYSIKETPNNSIINNNHFDETKIKTTEISNVLVFGGDIMLSRTVNSKMSTYQDYTWPFKKIATLFSEADLAIANLESPFLFTNNYEVKSGSFSFKANPQSVKALLLAGFDVLSLANNHILNQGRQGILDTYKVLDETGISSVGTKERSIVIKESKGVKFAFLAYSYDQSSPLISGLDPKQLVLDIKEAKTKSDIVVILMHAGTEYKLEPNAKQIEFAHAAIDAGADLVIGHHPHWPQLIEHYQGKTIIYSLGNLIFDQEWSSSTKEGLVVKVYFKDKQLENIEYIPIEIKDFGQASIMPPGDNYNKMLKNIKALD